MALWPDAAQLKQVVDVRPEDGDWDDMLDRVMAAGIRFVKLDVSGTEAQFDIDYPEPDDNLAQAALRAAELISLKPEVASAISRDPAYARLVFGHRKRFGIA